MDKYTPKCSYIALGALNGRAAYFALVLESAVREASREQKPSSTRPRWGLKVTLPLPLPLYLQSRIRICRIIIESKYY